jgi:hypothetical protein
MRDAMTLCQPLASYRACGDALRRISARRDLTTSAAIIAESHISAIYV